MPQMVSTTRGKCAICRKAKNFCGAESGHWPWSLSLSISSLHLIHISTGPNPPSIWHHILSHRCGCCGPTWPVFPRAVIQGVCMISIARLMCSRWTIYWIMTLMAWMCAGPGYRRVPSRSGLGGVSSSGYGRVSESSTGTYKTATCTRRII